MQDYGISLRVRMMRGAEIILGPGRADLLTQIALSGSIAAAGRQMGMSYKRAWALVEAMNATFKAPLVEAAKGGVGGGGARLTAAGERVLAAYRSFQAAAAAGGESFLAELADELAVPRKEKDG
jgi:molybdate transport system regulatory protein